MGSFRPNAFELYDTAGNATEWVEECWNLSYPRRAQRRIGLDERRLLASRSPRRLVRGQGDFCALLGAFSLRRGRSILRKRLSGGARPGLTGGALLWKDTLVWVVGRSERARGSHGQASQVRHVRDLSGVGACDLLVSLWAAEPRRHRLCPRKAERGRRPRRPGGHSVYRRGAGPSGCPVARVA